MVGKYLSANASVIIIIFAFTDRLVEAVIKASLSMLKIWGSFLGHVKSNRTLCPLPGQSNGTQCCQRFTTAAMFLRSCVVHCADAKPRRWAPPLVACFGVI